MQSELSPTAGPVPTPKLTPEAQMRAVSHEGQGHRCLMAPIRVRPLTPVTCTHRMPLPQLVPGKRGDRDCLCEVLSMVLNSSHIPPCLLSQELLRSSWEPGENRFIGPFFGDMSSEDLRWGFRICFYQASVILIQPVWY